MQQIQRYLIIYYIYIFNIYYIININHWVFELFTPWGVISWWSALLYMPSVQYHLLTSFPVYPLSSITKSVPFPGPCLHCFLMSLCVSSYCRTLWKEPVKISFWSLYTTGHCHDNNSNIFNNLLNGDSMSNVHHVLYYCIYSITM